MSTTTRTARSYDTFGGHRVAPSVVRELSTPGIVGTSVVSGHRADRETIELVDVPPEHNGALRVVCAELLRLACATSRGERLPCEFQHATLLPTEALTLEVRVHRSLRITGVPATTLCGTPILTIAQVADWKEATRLPLECQPEESDTLAFTGRTASLGDCHHSAVALIAQAQHSGMDEYATYRLVLSHPPIYSSAVMGFEIVLPDESA